MNGRDNVQEQICLYVKNPAFEFVEDEKGLVAFDENVGNIYRSNIIGKIIINTFSSPTTINDAIRIIQIAIDNVNVTDLSEFINQLIVESILAPVSV